MDADDRRPGPAPPAEAPPAPAPEVTDEEAEEEVEVEAESGPPPNKAASCGDVLVPVEAMKCRWGPTPAVVAALLLLLLLLPVSASATPRPGRFGSRAAPPASPITLESVLR